MRLSIGGGSIKYSNCINLELNHERGNTPDVVADVKKGLPFEDNYFEEVLMIHVIEHIEYNHHRKVFDEIYRVLKPDCRLVLSFPDAIECMKAFIENKHGRRWELYHWCIFGRQDGAGDYHVSAIEQRDITNKLINSGFGNVKYIKNRINATVSCYKKEKLKEYL